MSTASLISLVKRAAASSTSLLSKFAPTASCTSLLSKLAPTTSWPVGSDDDQDYKDRLYLRMKIPGLPKERATFSVEQNTMIVKEKNSGMEIERLSISAPNPIYGSRLNGTKGEIENGIMSLWLSRSPLNEDEEVMTRFDEYEGGFYAQMKQPGVDKKDHYKLFVRQNKMILADQGSERENAVAYLPPNLHMPNGTKGEMKDGVWSIWFPKVEEV
ncbi:hypothetical protein QQ045_012042 [Rhodiola kirilowii]